MEFFDVHEHTKYKVTVSRPENVEELSDCFITEDELKDIVGPNFWYQGNSPRTFINNTVVSAELDKWAAKLEESGKRTLLIEDEELLGLLKDKNYVSDFIDGKYGRHGDRICFSRRYERKKTKPTKTDVREFWIRIFPCAFRDKFGCYQSHIPTYDRHLPHFKAWKKILGWKRCSQYMNDGNKKFYRQIWDHPEEYV